MVRRKPVVQMKLRSDVVPVYADSAEVEDGTGAAGHIQRHVKLRTTTL